jgi:hypothetical protein
LIDLSGALSSLISAIQSAISLSGCLISADITSLVTNLAVIDAGVAVALTKVSEKSTSLQAVVGGALTLTTFNTSNATAFKSSVTTNLPQFKIDSATFMATAVTPDTTPKAGQVLTANTTGEPYWADNIAMRNRIINGNMYTAQRATSATVTAGTAVPTASAGYPCVDRWFVYSTGANVTAAQTTGIGAAPSAKFGLQVTGAASVTAIGIGQRIEVLNSYDMAGQTCTLSAFLSNSLLTTVTWTVSYANASYVFGTIGTPTKTLIATGTFTVTSSLAQYSASFSVPAAAKNGIEILFTVGAQTSGTFVVSNVQYEMGSVATPFETLPYSTQLVLCQRYYTSLPNQAITGYNGAGLLVYNQVTLPALMYSTPTITYSLLGNSNASTAVLNVATTIGFQSRTTITATGAGYSVVDNTLSAEIP